MHATKAAVEEGIVPGGGVTLLRAQKVLDGLELDGDEGIGVQIVRRALEEPLRQIVNNAGLEGSVIVEKLRSTKKTQGFNASTMEYSDMIADGVIDPAMVTRAALQNAASVSGLLLTTEAMVVELPEDKPEMPMGDPSGGMGGMGGF